MHIVRRITTMKAFQYSTMHRTNTPLTQARKRHGPMSYARLEAEARRLNVEITCHKHGPKGAWIPHLKRVSIREDLVGGGGLLVHLLPAGHSPCNELAADRWAARALIDADEYRELERLFPGEDFLISQELGVTRHLLGVWRRHEAWRCAPQLLDVF